MPNARVSAASGALPAELPTFEDIAAVVIRKSAQRLDAMRRSINRELKRHDRSRAKLEALIETLIEGLDTLDGDIDREGDYSSGRPVDPDFDIDISDEPHDDERMFGVDAEPSLGAPEGCRHDQTGWTAGCSNDCEDDPAEAGIADDGALDLANQERSDAAALAAHARFNGSGSQVALNQLARRGYGDVINGRAPRPAMVRVGGCWYPR